MTSSSVLELIGRSHPLFRDDVAAHEEELTEAVRNGRFLVLGGGGSIGRAVAREIFRRSPRTLHVVDLSENNLAELVRDLRSSLGYIEGDFQTFALDIGSLEYDAFIRAGDGYDYVLNLSALKHVRSERDPFTLMRMLDVNVFNTDRTVQQTAAFGGRKYFAVSTDKAANPANLMGASKRIMELFLMRRSETIPISTARFANVAFSDGSLLHSFEQRLVRRQPIVAPGDVRRYFITESEAGELCLLSCLLGDNRDTFFPSSTEELQPRTFAEIAEAFLLSRGLKPTLCGSEEEARALAADPRPGHWPLFVAVSDTTGEKDLEEFYTAGQDLDFDRFPHIGVIRTPAGVDAEALDRFESAIAALKAAGTWTKADVVPLIQQIVPELDHRETGTSLDGKM